jgi:hypothetical protein
LREATIHVVCVFCAAAQLRHHFAVIGENKMADVAKSLGRRLELPAK